MNLYAGGVGESFEMATWHGPSSSSSATAASSSEDAMVQDGWRRENIGKQKFGPLRDVKSFRY
jgi:hypothetical protein